MTSLIQFPGLGWEFELSRVAFKIFGINVYWYGICIGIGLVLAVLFAFSQCNSFGIDGDRMIDVILVGFVCAIIGGRLYYVIFSNGQYSNFWEIIDLRSGGIAIYGAILGAFGGAAVTCKLRKVPLLPLFDLASMGFLIGQAVGRWGNFFNQEAFGGNTTLPWGMLSKTTSYYLTQNQEQLAQAGVIVDPALPVHPTFLYESLWCALGFLLLFLYRKHRKFNGEITLFYMMWYGLGRFFIEGLRTDSLVVGSTARVSQILAAVMVVVALAIWIVARIKTKGKPLVVPEIPPHTERVRVVDGDGERMVTVSWPANAKTPSEEEKQQLAKENLAEQKEKNKALFEEIKAEEEKKDGQTTDVAIAADTKASIAANDKREYAGKEAQPVPEFKEEPHGGEDH